MKKIKELLLLSFFCLNMTIAQASELSAESLNDKLTQNDIEKTIDSLISVLKTHYLFADKALLIENDLRYKLASNKFDKIHDGYSFIREINLIMREVSGDMHLDIVETKPTVRLDKVTELDNSRRYGIESTNILSGNVGYFKLSYFYHNPNTQAAASLALKELSKVDALIIDLRSAEGDSIALVQYLMSFFAKENTLLSEVFYDKQSQSKMLLSLENIGHDNFRDNFPVYILTSSLLSGSAEFFSYTLKHLNKAVIVGEETMGVAYILQKQKINAHFSLNMPIAIPIHPKTLSNWEGIGVIPDIPVAADLALDAAHKKAKEHLHIF